MSKVSVIGPGRWGTFLAWYLVNYKKYNNVLLYGLENSISFQNLKKNRENEYLKIPDKLTLTSDLHKTLQSDYIIISIDAQNLNDLSLKLNDYDLNNKTFILAMKGIDIKTRKRLSQIMFDNINQNIRVAVLLGPGHVQDYTRGIPNCAVIDSNEEQTKIDVVNLLRSPLMRLYYGVDLIGNEIGGAYKNVIGIGAGMLDALGWCSLKGALMSRSVVEVGRFIEKCGGNSRSASGLAFLGDFEATLFSKHSNNRLFGELFIKGEKTTKNCEGYYTLKAVYEMGREFKIELPITNTLYNIIYNGSSVDEGLNSLFGRDLKKEF